MMLLVSLTMVWSVSGGKGINLHFFKRQMEGRCVCPVAVPDICLRRQAPWHLSTAATRSGRCICHRQRSPRSPPDCCIYNCSIPALDQQKYHPLGGGIFIGGGEGNRTPVRKQLGRNFSGRSLLFTFPYPDGNKHSSGFGSFIMRGARKA